MLRSSLVRTLTDKSQLAPDSACCCATTKRESTSTAKTHASARTIFPPLSGLCAPVNFRPFQTLQQRNSFRRYFLYFHSGRQPGTAALFRAPLWPRIAPTSTRARAPHGHPTAYNVSVKSLHPGFTDSISAAFFCLLHFLISFSQAIAARAVECGSYQTNLVTLYFLVNPLFCLCLWIPMRFAIPPVTPK